jgi:hypothetical protein
MTEYDPATQQLNRATRKINELEMRLEDERAKHARELARHSAACEAKVEAAEKARAQLVTQHASLCTEIAERVRHMNGLVELALLYEREDAEAREAGSTAEIFTRSSAAETTARAIVETIKRKRTETP